MNVNLFLLIAFCIALLFILFLATELRRVRGQLSIIEESLEDIKNGNANRRVLAGKSDMTKRICYTVNEIAIKNQSQLASQKQSEQAYKQLMTSNFLRIDPHSYTRILNNLLQNTLMHSGGNKLTLKLLENEQQVKIIISDNGKGISTSDIPHIFERMYQCDRSRSALGNGLGLSITQELVNAHNGKIKADSQPGTGAVFTILFPKAL